MKNKTRFDVTVPVANNSQGCLMIFIRGAAQCPVDRSWCAQRFCDGVAAATELRRPAPSRSLGRDAQNEEATAFIFPVFGVDLNFNAGRGPQSPIRPPPMAQ